MIEKGKSLNPKFDRDGKNNYQEFSLIKKDGSIITRTILFISNVDKREEVICHHFLSRYTLLFVGELVGVKILSRDNPWDFEVELSNSENLIIEITSIADEEGMFKAFTSQERIAKYSHLELIEFHELKKQNYLFPDPNISDLIASYQEKGVKKNDLVKNPNFGKKLIFKSTINENLESLDVLLKDAIDKKVKKKHRAKEQVTLIIDNRTVSFDLDAVIDYLDTLEKYFSNLPFKEVWFYTGYYSDLDGNNSEYTLIPLKISDAKYEQIANRLS